jgi:hypothetical protein
MKPISEFILHLECPTIDGIIFQDETIQLFNVKADRGPYRFNIKTADKTTISALKEKGNLSWNSCAIMTTLIDSNHSIQIVAGEGNWGSDGFVGVIDLKSKKLIWLAFFTSSNPFDKLKIVNDEIHATSTLDCTWKFKLKNPINISVSCV